jgi:hypothetical protein
MEIYKKITEEFNWFLIPIAVGIDSHRFYYLLCISDYDMFIKNKH